METIKKHIIETLHHIEEKVKNEEQLDRQLIHEIHELCEALHSIDKIGDILHKHTMEYPHHHSTPNMSEPHNPMPHNPSKY